MKKYISILKMSFLDSFQYISSILLKFITYFITMFILSNVWKYIYSDPGKIINGYSLVQMIWYLLIAESISYGSSDIGIKEVNEDIRNGEIAYKVNKPYHYVTYIFMRSMGDSIIRLVLYLTVSIILGFIIIGPLSFEFTLINILCVLLTVIFSVLINNLIRITISLLSFWVVDSYPFHWIYKKIILLFGIFFPIEMFPKVLRKVIKATPVLVTVYGPTKLIIDFSMDLFKNVILAQIIYFVIVMIISNLLYKKGVKKLNVNGG